MSDDNEQSSLRLTRRATRRRSGLLRSMAVRSITWSRRSPDTGCALRARRVPCSLDPGADASCECELYTRKIDSAMGARWTISSGSGPRVHGSILPVQEELCGTIHQRKDFEWFAERHVFHRGGEWDEKLSNCRRRRTTRRRSDQ